MEIRKAAKEDYFNLLSFVNKQFSEDFLSFMPKVYLNEDKILTHFIIEHDNKIIACCCYIETEYLGCKFIGIGSVCVDTEYRNKGLMSLLINEVLKLECDMFYLLGDRKRYEHYGFYKTGLKTTFILSRFDSDVHDVTLIDNPQASIIEHFYELYNNLNLVSRPKEDYYYTLKTAKADVYSLNNEGYLVYNPGTETILEIVNANNALASIKGLMNALNLKKISIDLSKQDPNYKIIYEASSRYIEQTLANIKIINYEKIIYALLSNKNNIMYGRLVIQIGENNLEIQVGEQISVEYTDKKADFALSEKEFHLLVFSRYPIDLDRRINSLLNSWFPLELPITLNSIDTI